MSDDAIVSDAYGLLWALLAPDATVAIRASGGFEVHAKDTRRGIDVIGRGATLDDAIREAFQHAQALFDEEPMTDTKSR